MSTKREVIGKGMDALFSGVQRVESEKQTLESGQNLGPEIQRDATRLQSAETGVQIECSNEQSIDASVLRKAIDEARTYPKCSIWSPMVMAVFRYRQLTTVRYKMSAEACDLLENAVEERYPELCRVIKETMAKSRDSK